MSSRVSSSLNTTNTSEWRFERGEDLILSIDSMTIVFKSSCLIDSPSFRNSSITLDICWLFSPSVGHILRDRLATPNFSSILTSRSGVSQYKRGTKYVAGCKYISEVCSILAIAPLYLRKLYLHSQLIEFGTIQKAIIRPTADNSFLSYN